MTAPTPTPLPHRAALLDALTARQRRCITLYIRLTDAFIHAVDSRAPLARRHTLADRSDAIRRMAWWAGIKDIDFHYHLAKARDRGAEYFASGSKTYCTADYMTFDYAG